MILLSMYLQLSLWICNYDNILNCNKFNGEKSLTFEFHEYFIHSGNGAQIRKLWSRCTHLYMFDIWYVYMTSDYSINKSDIIKFSPWVIVTHYTVK